MISIVSLGFSESSNCMGYLDLSLCDFYLIKCLYKLGFLCDWIFVTSEGKLDVWEPNLGDYYVVYGFGLFNF